MDKQLRSGADIEKMHYTKPPLIESVGEELYNHIQGGVIDAFDREGQREVERRIANLYRKWDDAEWCKQHNERCGEKERVAYVGDENGVELFHHNIFGDGAFRVALTHYKMVFASGKIKGFDGDKNYTRIPAKGIENPSVFIFESKQLTQQLIDEFEKDQATGTPITTLVTLWQDGHDKYLKMFADALPWVDVYNVCYLDPTGQGRSFQRRWRTGASMFETQSELTEDAELRWVIENIAHEGESTWFGAPPKQGKTWVQLCVAKALLTGEPLFGDERLKVPRKAQKVIYLCPETGKKPFAKRLKMLGLVEHVHDPLTNPSGRLFVRTLSAGEKIRLSDPALLEAAQGADVFLDTAIRWLDGDPPDANAATILSHGRSHSAANCDQESSGENVTNTPGFFANAARISVSFCCSGVGNPNFVKPPPYGFQAFSPGSKGCSDHCTWGGGGVA